MTKNSFSVHSDLVRWVLVETSHAGNVGSTARALKTMGFEQLHLIRPRQENMHEDAEAIALASGASDVLAKTTISQSLSQALHSCGVVLGLTSREREFD
jgi:tRNA/rRNA methyltransferase